MAESADSLFRRGMISPKQASKLKALAGTKLNPAFGAAEEGANGRGGLRDQGAGRERGETAVAGNAHINNRRASDFGSPGRASGRPSAGGGVRSKGGRPGADEINAGGSQRPAFPAGSKPRRQALGTPQRARGTVQPSGPLYGGPSSRADG